MLPKVIAQGKRNAISKSKIISTLLSILFTFCPPGAEDLENRHLISLDGITNVLVIFKSIFSSF